MKLRLSSSRCETCPAKGEPAQPVASLAPFAVTRAAKRRHASVWAVGSSLEKLDMPGAEGVVIPEGDGGRSVRWARNGSHPAGSWTTARRKRTAQAPGRPSFSSTTTGATENPVILLRRLRAADRAAGGKEKRPHRGRPQARGTGAAADGARESEGCKVAWTLGNGVAPGPG